MSAPPTAASAGERPPGADAPRDLPDPADRGRLRVNPSVVRRIAERCADLTPGTVRAPRGMGRGDRGARAHVSGSGHDVDIELDVALRYPSAVRETADALRHRITEEVSRVTGYHVRSVHVTVSALLPETPPRVE
ncbi:putative conserved protein YloU, alkaline shock protein (Asp23) family [Streptoalloteichus tenebrarius]|uniref:Conserved protein YloU, alkaline shock protein (Asp23) family n=1 Tax=Streptoalloteichus tenebrarius (strain ATCC 17920 / DSM 40477 / JCM 4838 / CBS 697.72 / NBRC 16177 / NCIMB 11028 / NRRL B-12390 / A12253. 1 / ISP 5477) TaxID=1933 RepID=A0ABT1HS31_STRSD|nr:Asp23/Gls24 family envelope stress response protein [Streptoalloteichus tenebrarius]MCP2258328.1 putative conserved protein YloU, alkaline shock protein (Asp23) family [Streptoalloteichus tenebrarius]BFF03494.1 Asp23/Gls24 family envelope stress response protein [Streptoalloteichus tenebrarius]